MKILSIELSSNPICPKCGGSNVGFGVSHRGSGSQAECRDCGYCWE